MVGSILFAWIQGYENFAYCFVFSCIVINVLRACENISFFVSLGVIWIVMQRNGGK